MKPGLLEKGFFFTEWSNLLKREAANEGDTLQIKARDGKVTFTLRKQHKSNKVTLDDLQLSQSVEIDVNFNASLEEMCSKSLSECLLQGFSSHIKMHVLHGLQRKLIQTLKSDAGDMLKILLLPVMPMYLTTV